MRWSTRAGVHIDRAACAWLICRFKISELWIVAAAGTLGLLLHWL